MSRKPQNALAGNANLDAENKENIAAKDLKLRKRYRLWTAGITAVLLVAIFMLLLTQCGADDKKKMQNSTEPSQQMTTVPETLEVQAEWSDWMDTLPSFAASDDYLIEEQSLYRSRTLETTSSTTENTMDGWELYDTIESSGDFGEWSDWSATEVSASDTREVETEICYRYRDKETTTGSSSSMSGWELYDTTYTWSSYGNWSDWSTNAVSSTDSRDVETKTQYRYRTKSYTSSSNSSLSGWTQYDASVFYGVWSGWSDTPISSSSTREVETQQVQTGTKYYIAHYCTGNTGDDYKYRSSNWKYHDQCAYHELGWFDSLDAFEVNGNQVIYYPNGSMYRCSNTCYIFFIMDTQNIYKTQYRYRDIYMTYYFYQWGPWSNYSDTYVSSNSDREVETRTLYRYRDRQAIPTCFFWRWGEWSEWSTDAVSQTNNRQVETKLYYRYRDQVLVTTYYFKRWGEWSDYSTTAIAGSDTVEVETKTQYRYKLK